MKQAEFEQFVEAEGKDILRFCRILTASREIGDELYQDATEDYQVRSFTRFTVAYDNQTPKGSDIMLVDDSVSGEYANRLFDANGEPDLESQRQALAEILSQVVIDCSVEYTDGSSASMSVSPSVRIALNTQTAEDSGSDFENEYLEVTIQKQ